MRAQMVKWGNSLAIRIPKNIAQEAELSAGDAIELAVAAKGSVELRRVDKVPSLAQLVSQITPENRYEEVASGRTVGKEAIEW
jgi:antitoxin MazE